MDLPTSLAPLSEVFWRGHSPAIAADTSPHAITVVTAFFDLGRAQWRAPDASPSPFQRGVDRYFERFAHLAKLENDMVVFVAPDHAARVLAIRREAGLAERTTIVTIAGLFDREPIATVETETRKRMTRRFQRWVLQPQMPEYREPRYILINALKAAFVGAALDLGLVRDSQTAWIDFGYCGDDKRFDAAKPWRFDAGDKMNLFHITALDILPIYRVVRYGTVYFQGCHIVGPNAAWPAFAREMSFCLAALLAVDLIDDDQTLQLMAWRRNPGAYRIHGVSPKDWRIIFKRFNLDVPLENVEPPKARRAREESTMREELRIQMKRWEWWFKKTFRS